ncbi:MAG: hypothetical protein JXR87_09420 [Candidatus Marinimicrobia bacterium]|nr:hypothetical protein [Candidatus Neomarinimicrobiota bacterium]
MLREAFFRTGQILIVSLFSIVSINAEPLSVTLESSVDTTIATIGDRIHLNVTMQYPNGIRFDLPELNEKLGTWDILNQIISEPKKVKGGFQQNWSLELTVFDTGKVVVPVVELQAVDISDSTQSLLFQTDEFVVDVISVLPPGTTEPKDIKPPFAIRKIIPWSLIIFGLLIVAILFGWWIYYRRWKQQQPTVPLDEHYLEAPHVTAFRKLDELKSHLYKTEDEIRQFYFQLSEIVREYLERRFFIKALEMTTREIMESVTETDIGPGIDTEYKTLFDGLDLVKFAKMIPAVEEMITYWDLAYNCIDKTKREPFLNRRSS